MKKLYNKPIMTTTTQTRPIPRDNISFTHLHKLVIMTAYVGSPLAWSYGSKVLNYEILEMFASNPLKMDYQFLVLKEPLTCSDEIAREALEILGCWTLDELDTMDEGRTAIKGLRVVKHVCDIFAGRRTNLPDDLGKMDETKVYMVYRRLIETGHAVPLIIAPGHLLNGRTAVELGMAVLDINYRPSTQIDTGDGKEQGL